MLGASGVPRFISRIAVFVILLSDLLLLACKFASLLTIKKYVYVSFKLFWCLVFTKNVKDRENMSDGFS